ncbi:MAG: MBL fold metallo-hydrolase [Rhodospirillales bacterium]
MTPAGLLTIKRIVSGKLRQNGYVVAAASRNALVIDPGAEFECFIDHIDDNSLNPLAIINTHAHFDHIGGVVPLMERFGIPFFLDRGDSRVLRSANIYKHLFEGTRSVEIPEITQDLADAGATFEVGEFTVTNISSPGHTPGGRSFLIGNDLFTGDTLFRNNVGRTDLYGGDEVALTASLQCLFELPPETMIHPGHGQPSTLGEERVNNKKVIALIGSSEPMSGRTAARGQG